MFLRFIFGGEGCVFEVVFWKFFRGFFFVRVLLCDYFRLEIDRVGADDLFFFEFLFFVLESG